MATWEPAGRAPTRFVTRRAPASYVLVRAFKEIADILGHRSINTTAIYAKVDLERLAGVALPWPQVRS